MLIVIPIYSKDVALAEKLSELIATQGGVQDHTCLVVCGLDAKGQLDKVIEHLRTAFADVKVFQLDNEDAGEWPVPHNHMFARTVEHLRNTGNREKWYLFGVDSTPLRPTWLDEMELEYNSNQKPFMGVALKSPPGGINGDGGEFIAGSAIYPPDFHRRSLLWQYLTTTDPWDVYLRWEVRPGAHVTEKIVFNWKSENYRYSPDGRIICDGVGKDSITDPITKETAVVHGCKDGSLIDLLYKPKPIK